MYKYRIAVCDDEKLIRNGICKFIGDAFENAEIAASLSDGEEVIEFLKTGNIDILITDIRMKNVDGIAVAEYITEKSPQTKLIFITGYQNFEYAQKAINLHVSGFVSKPVDFGVLKKLVENCIDELNRKASFAISSSNGILLKHNAIKENIRNYYYGEISLQAFKSTLRIQEPEMLTSSAELVHFNALSGEINSNDPYRIWDDFADMENEYFKVFTIVGNRKNAVFVVILNSDNSSYRKMRDYLKELKKNIKIACKAEFEYNCIPIKNVCDIYAQNDRYVIDLYLERAFAGDVEGVKDIEKIMMYSLSFNRIRSVIEEILKFAEVSNNDENIIKIRNVLEKVRIRNDFNEVFEKMRDLQFKNNDSESSLTAKALEYISKHYGDEISLNTLSEYLCISTAHFSRIFKRDTGKNFKDYVTDFRINKAKELFALGRYSVKEVSYKVGFQNPLYFGQVFKRNVGIAPHDYSVKSKTNG